MCRKNYNITKWHLWPFWPFWPFWPLLPLWPLMASMTSMASMASMAIKNTTTTNKTLQFHEFLSLSCCKTKNVKKEKRKTIWFIRNLFIPFCFIYLTCRNSAFKEKENPRVNKGFHQLLSKTQISLKVYLSQLYITWVSSNGLFEINCNSKSL